MQLAAKKARITIVDDEPINHRVLSLHLRREGFADTFGCHDSADAVELFEREKPDLLLLDMMMPRVAGVETLRTLRAEAVYATAPITVLTASADVALKRQSLELGGADFLCKPIDPIELLPKVRNPLCVKALHDALQSRSGELESLVRARTAALEASRKHVIDCLARAGEFREADMALHVLRVAKYAAVVAQELGLPAATVQLIELAAPLNDVSKIGIPDSILRKTGKLTPDQIAWMRRHCDDGEQIVAPIPLHSRGLNRTSGGFEEQTALEHSHLLESAAIDARRADADSLIDRLEKPSRCIRPPAVVGA